MNIRHLQQRLTHYWKRHRRLISLLFVLGLAIGVYWMQNGNMRMKRMEYIKELEDADSSGIIISNILLTNTMGVDTRTIVEVKGWNKDSSTFVNRYSYMASIINESDIAKISPQFYEMRSRANPWAQAFFSCYVNETFRKNVIYLGPSNQRYLGTILSNDKQSTKRELTYIIPEQEFDKFASSGVSVNSCDLRKVKGLSAGALFNVAELVRANPKFSFQIENADSIVVTGGEWQIDYLRTDDFLEYVNQSTDPRVKSYRETLLKKGSLLITQVVKVSGFKADIYAQRDLHGEVQGGAALDSAQLIIRNNTSFKLKMDK